MAKSIVYNKFMGALKRVPSELTGSTARNLRNVSNSLNKSESLGIKGVPETAKLRAERLAQVAEGKSKLTRGRVGALAVAGGATAAYKVHSNHEQEKNRILNRIDSMY